MNGSVRIVDARVSDVIEKITQECLSLGLHPDKVKRKYAKRQPYLRGKGYRTIFSVLAVAHKDMVSFASLLGCKVEEVMCGSAVMFGARWFISADHLEEYLKEVKEEDFQTVMETGYKPIKTSKACKSAELEVSR